MLRLYELILRFLEKFPTMVCEHATPAVRGMVATHEKVRKNRDELREVDRATADARQRIAGELAAIQAQCGHQVTTHHADPTGGSDSHTACEVCGKVL